MTEANRTARVRLVGLSPGRLPVSPQVLHEASFQDAR
jgi:hypothetical protein